MSRRTRTTLAVIGLLIILISLAVLVYALWPAGSASQQIPLPTDIFNQPEASLPWGRS